MEKLVFGSKYRLALRMYYWMSHLAAHCLTDSQQSMFLITGSFSCIIMSLIFLLLCRFFFFSFFCVSHCFSVVVKCFELPKALCKFPLLLLLSLLLKSENSSVVQCCGVLCLQAPAVMRPEDKGLGAIQVSVSNCCSLTGGRGRRGV